MARHRVGRDSPLPPLPPLPEGEKRDRQVKVRLTPSELAQLQSLRPDLTPAGVVGFLIDDVLTGRYCPEWAAPNQGQVRPED